MDLMFWVSKFLLYFLLPPGILVILFLYASYIAKSLNRVFFILVAILLWIFSTPLFSYFFSYFIENSKASNPNSYYRVAPKEVEAVVVLGLGIFENSPSFHLSPESTRNTLYGYKIAKELNTPLIFSGKGLKSISESRAAKEMFKSLDLNSVEITYEDESLTTNQNAIFTERVLGELNITKIALVSSSWHIDRAIEEFKSQNITLFAMPSDIPTKSIAKDNLDLTLLDFIPNIDSFRESHTLLKEFLGELKSAI